MAGIISVGPTGNQDTDGVLRGIKWDALDLAYSFPTSASFYGAGYGKGEPQNDFEPLNAAQIAAVRTVLKMVSSVTNLNFTEMTETATNHAALRFAMSDAPESAWTYELDGSQESGDTWYGNSIGWYDAPVRGNYAFYTTLHEIGHSLGLKHGNDADKGFGAMSAAHDSMEYSVETYRSYVGADGLHVENEEWGYAQTLMMHDIAALQHMYGADFSTRSGNTAYRWDPATGQAFIDGVAQGAPGDNRIFMTVWDGGGIDDYDFSRYATNLTVDLQPGAWITTSSAQIAQLGPDHRARGSIANALTYHGDERSLIENTIGGSGNDRITGNSAANAISGKSGADRLNGLAGNDILAGGLGNDVLTGGAGKDYFVFDSKPNRSANMDRITDFRVVDHTIRVDDAVFTHAGKVGALSAAAFWTGSKAHDTSDRFVYDSGTGALYYDADGTGSAAQIQFALLAKSLKMAAADFQIV
jgi:serralysin